MNILKELFTCIIFSFITSLVCNMIVIPILLIFGAFYYKELFISFLLTWYIFFIIFSICCFLDEFF